MQFENDRVRITEVVYQPGIPRERYVRPTDQIIIFLDDCKFERIDSQTNDKVIRERRSGDTLWHEKGEHAPVLTNIGSEPYRTLLIELKK